MAGADPWDDEDITHPFESEIQDYPVEDTAAWLEEIDKQIHAHIFVPGAEYDNKQMVLAKIIGKKRDIEGNPIGEYN